MEKASLNNVYNSLIDCYNKIEIQLEKKDLFLFGFFLCSKFNKNQNSLNHDTFLEIHNEFIDHHLIENNKNIFNIEHIFDKNISKPLVDNNHRKNDLGDLNDKICNNIKNNDDLNQVKITVNKNDLKNLREEYSDLYSQMLGIKPQQENRNNAPNELVREYSNENSYNEFNLFQEDETSKSNLDQSLLDSKTNLKNQNEGYKYENDHELNNMSIGDKIIGNLNENLININSERNKYSNDSLGLMRFDSNKSETGIILNCNICQSDFYTADLENLKIDCGHYMHFECFKAYIQNRLGEANLNIKCFECSKEVSPANIQFFLYQLGEDYFDKYEKLCINNFVTSRVCEMMWCPTPGCDFAFEMLEKFERFCCRICGKTWCLKCRVKFHEDKTCIEYRKEIRKLAKEKNLLVDEKYLDEQFDKAVKDLNYKPCPKCKFWIEKNEGCNHMTCICKFEFCYVCGLGYNRRKKVCFCP